MPVDVQITGQATDHQKTDRLVETIKTRLETIYRALELRDPHVSLLLTDDEAIRQLNEQWRGIDEATDVLSFPAHHPESIPDEPSHLGDIVISIPCATRLVDARDHGRRVAEELDVDAESLDWKLVDEVAFLFVHGLLHLLGYDHADADEEAQMRTMERRLWQLMTEEL